MKRNIVAVVGQPSSGKDVCADELARALAISHVSSSDLIRTYIREHRAGDLTRENMQKVGKRLRLENGADFLVREALRVAGGPVLVSALRTSGEIATVKKMGGMIVAVTAPIARRYEWSRARGRVGDGVTLAAFRKLEEQESRASDDISCNVEAALAAADFTIENDGTKEDLFVKIQDVAEKLKRQ